MKKGLIYPTISSSGTDQMALDLIMLDRVLQENILSLAFRFYYWEGFWLSIGKNQDYLPKKWRDLQHEGKIKLIRRPTGGKAVLHGGGLTYALAWKNPPKKKKEAYVKSSQWLIKGFKEFGMNLRFGSDMNNDSSPNCFLSSTPADLIDERGLKRIGSAQLWKKGSLLQHGEIIISPPKNLWVELFNSEPPEKYNKKFKAQEIESSFTKEVRCNWKDIFWEETKFENEELKNIISFKEQLIV